MRHLGGSACAAALFVGFFLMRPLEGRVVSYGPVTSRPAEPAIQKRTSRHVVLLEELTQLYASLVVYDSLAHEDPRDVTPGGSPTTIFVAAAREDAEGLSLLVQTSTVPFPGTPPAPFLRWHYSRDGGASWTLVALPGNYAGFQQGLDVGGPDVRRGAVIVGTRDVPFLVAIRDSAANRLEIWALRADGSTAPLSRATSDSVVLGSDQGGSRLLLAGIPYDASASGPGTPPPPRGLWILSPSEAPTLLAESSSTFLSGWIEAGGGAYVLGGGAQIFRDLPRSVSSVRAGEIHELAAARGAPGGPDWPFAVPDADFSGAWLVQNGSQETVLSHHTPSGGLVENRRDAETAAITALHVGSSGTRLLAQASSTRGLIAIASWEVGRKDPASFDAIAVRTSGGGFVHVDADTVGGGEPFFLHTGRGFIPDYGGNAPCDGYQPPAPLEWSVVRGMLQGPRLIVPAAAHLEGPARTWRTDLVLRNAGASSLAVEVAFAPNLETATAVSPVALVLPGASTSRIPDVLFTLFGLASGSGAVLLTPESGRALDATSRTYANADRGTYGMSVDAVDVTEARGLTTPATFSVGLFGDAFRSNLVSTDMGGRGAVADVHYTGGSGENDGVTATLTETPSTQSQISGLGSALRASPEARTLTYAPGKGESVAGLIQIHDLTNDPAWMPPDLPSAGTRMIPAIVHASGSRGAVFRSDVSLLNPGVSPQTVRLFAQDWAAEEPEQELTLVLQPGESRVMRDVLFTVFARTGVARLRVQTIGPCDGLGEVRDGIRVTSRVYAVAPSGGSFGMLVPPLESSQMASSGDSLEILLPEGGAGFRTNLAFVSTLPAAVSGTSTASVEVFDDTGRLLDSFTVDVLIPGGRQVSDLFRARELGVGPRSGWIRVTSLSGAFAAYATVVDNETNDPLYAPGVLSATP